jgi:NAD(P)-dependent dehydrogenase (short-subunit alcohol dehydrogenase family)
LRPLLDNRVVIVAGVGPGLGVALVRRCATHGARVVAAARTGERLEAVVREVEAQDGRALGFTADLTDASDCAGLIEAALHHFGTIDALIFNAFQQPPFELVEEQTVDVVRSSFEINVFAALTLSQLAIPTMRARGSGAILFVNSAILRQTRPGFGAYKMAKHALLGLSRNLALEVGPAGIRVNSIAPSYIWGESVEQSLRSAAEARAITLEDMKAEVCSAIPRQRFTDPDEIADAAAFLVSDLARAVTGQCLDVNGGEFCH